MGGTSGTLYTSSYTSSFVTWTAVTSPETMQVNGIATVDGVIVYLVGTGSDGKGRLYHSTNSGSSWTRITNVGSTVALYSISLSSSSEIMVQGASLFVARSWNSGSTWSSMTVFTSGSTTSTRPPHALSMYSRTIAVAGSISGALRETDNGGLSWFDATTLGQGKSIYSAKIYSTDVGVAGKLNDMHSTIFFYCCRF